MNAGVLAPLGLAGLFCVGDCPTSCSTILASASRRALLEGSIALLVIAAVAKWCSVQGPRVRATRSSRLGTVYFGTAAAVAVIVL